MRGSIPRAQKLIPVAAIATLAFAAAAIANASWSPWTPSRPGARSTSPVMLIATVHGRLSPGAGAPLTLSAENAGSFAVYISNVHLVGVSADAAHSRCDTGAFSMDDIAEHTQVPPRAAGYRLPHGGTFVFRDSGANQDSCEGATLTLSLSRN